MQFLSLSPTPHLPPKPFKPLSSSASFRRPSPSLPPSPKPSPPPPPPPPSPPPPNPLSSKLWLSSKLSPPPPPPETLEPLPPPPPPESEMEAEAGPSPQEEFRQKGKVFVGNLPLWARKAEIAEFFRQFGPLDKVELIRGHDDPERNVGFCFLYYGGEDAEAAAARAVEVDGVDFRGRSLTVRLDDGRRAKARAEERARWVEAGEGGGRREARSPWHEARKEACLEFRRVVESRPEDWQAVVSAFERIPKVASRIT